MRVVIATLLLGLISCRSKDSIKNSGDITPPIGLAFSIPSGDALYFDLITHDIVQQYHLDDWQITIAEVHPSGNWVAAADGVNNRVAVLTLPALGIMGSHMLSGVPADVHMSLSGHQVYAITNNGSFWAITLATGEIDTIDVMLNPRRMAFRPPSRQEVWVACPFNQTIYILDLIQRSLMDTIAFADPPSDVVFSPDGIKAYAAFESNPGYLLVLNAESHSVESSREIGLGSYDLDASPNGRYIAAADSTQGTVHLWDITTDSLWTVPVDPFPSRVRFLRDTPAFFVLSHCGQRILHCQIGAAGPVVVDTVDVTPTVFEFVIWEGVH